MTKKKPGAKPGRPRKITPTPRGFVLVHAHEPIVFEHESVPGVTIVQNLADNRWVLTMPADDAKGTVRSRHWEPSEAAAVFNGSISRKALESHHHLASFTGNGDTVIQRRGNPRPRTGSDARRRL